MLPYIFEFALILSYYFSRVLSMLATIYDIDSSHEFIISYGVFTALCVLGRLFSARLQKLLSHEWAPVAAHLLLYCTIFIGYGKFKTFYAMYNTLQTYIQLLTPELFAQTGGMSFLNESFIFVLALTTAFAIPFMKKSAALPKYLQKKCVFWLSLISLYSSFACFGDRLFFRESFQFGTLVLFLLGAMWIFPMLLQILCLYEAAAAKFNSVRGGAPTPINTFKTWLILFGIFMGVWIIYLVALNPAVVTTDTINAWRQAISGKKIGYLAFPSILIIFTRLLTYIIPHPAFVVFVQMTLMALLGSSFLITLYRHGVPKRFLYIFAFIWGILLPNGVMMVTLWSNIPYAMSLLFLTTVIIEIMHAKDISTWTLFKLALALPLTFTTRSEGFVPAILTIAFIFIFALRKPIKPKLILATVTGCVLIALIQGPLYYNLTTRSQEKGPIVAASSVLFLDGIQSVLYFGGDLAPETTAYLERFAPISDWKSAYNIYNTNYRGKLHQSLRKSHIATAEFASAVKEHYLKTLVREPFLLIQNRINKSNLVWDITQPDNVYGMERVSTEIYQHKYFNFPRHENMLTTVITRFVYPITVYIAPLDVLLYRSGIYVILSMLLCVYLSVHEMRKYLAAFIPMLGGILALLVSMAWPNYRYIWFIPVIFTFIAPYLLSCRKSQ